MHTTVWKMKQVRDKVIVFDRLALVVAPSGRDQPAAAE
jgi:hypothetical protein